MGEKHQQQDQIMDQLVSVIVPVYNVEKYLERCLKSLVLQTLEHIEIIVVNDDSPDDSQVIIDRLVEQYPDKIKAFSKPNGGLSDARNYGLQHATGEYIGFVDSDDYVDFDMYELMYNKAKQEDADVVCCGICYEFENKSYKKFYNQSFFGKSVVESPNILIAGNSFAWNKIYRRSFWEQHDFTYPVGQWFEDSALTYEILLRANQVAYVNLPFYHYLQMRSDALTKSIDPRIFDVLKSCEQIVSIYQQEGVFAELHATLEYICIRHLFARYKLFMTAKNNRLGLRYVKEVTQFLNQHFPGWKNSTVMQVSSTRRLKENIYALVRRSSRLSQLYMIAPICVKKIFLNSYQFTMKVLKTKGKSAKKRLIKQNETKRLYMKKNAYVVLDQIHEILDHIGVENFADFGTMLGLVRDGAIFAHDLDLDVGVIADDLQKDWVRIAFERKGLKLWRQYFLEGKIVQESYHFKNVKIDIAYYQMGKENCKTWLFYQKPGMKYPENNRNVVEMTYSPIQHITSQRIVDGYHFRIPENSNQILEQKYGPNWKTPDPSWIYWKSPAAKPLGEMGEFRTCRYSSSVDLDQENVFQQNNVEILQIIQQLQQEQLSIFDAVADLCRQHDIIYYVGGETLVGVLRHQQLIAWETRFTVWMERSEYERWLLLAEQQLEKSFQVEHYGSHRNHLSIGAKIRLVVDSCFTESPLEKKEILDKNGIGSTIEIIPLDAVTTDDFKKQRAQQKKLHRLQERLKYKTQLPQKKSIKYYYSKFYSRETLIEKIKQTCQQDSAPDAEYLIHLGHQSLRKKQVYPKAWYGKPRWIAVGERMMPIPQQAEKLSLSLYGDYLRIPFVYTRKIKQLLYFIDEKKKRIKIQTRTF